MFGGGSITLFHIRGIRIAVDWSWFLILFLVIFWMTNFYSDLLGESGSSVTPFALINDTEHKVRVVLDAEMLKQEPLNYHPLRNDRTISVSKDDLLKFVASCGHTPMIMNLPEMARPA